MEGNGGSRTLYTTLMNKKNLLASKFPVRNSGEAGNSSCAEPIALIENDVVDQTPEDTHGQNDLGFNDNILLEMLISQATKSQAEVFKHIFCERNVNCFKQYILTCLEKWKSDHYFHDKIETIFALTQYPDEHYALLLIYVFQGELGHLCQYYSHGCKHVPFQTHLQFSPLEYLAASLNRESELKWKPYRI